jgi:hypothetical protein
MVWRECRLWATPAQRPRQFLATPQVSLAQEEEVVELALFAPLGVALVFAELPVAQALEGFAFAASLLKDFLLLVAEVLQPQVFPLHGLPLLVKRLPARHGKT